MNEMKESLRAQVAVGTFFIKSPVLYFDLNPHL